MQIESWYKDLGRRRRRVPTVLQLEAAECGAASLAMILGYHGLFVPLEKLRGLCGVSRDGAKASSILKAARSVGLTAKGLKAELEHIRDIELPAIAFVNFCHFLVVERVAEKYVYLNDPAGGRRRVTWDEFDAMFTGVILTFATAETFKTADERPSVVQSLVARTQGFRLAILFTFLASLALILPGLALPIFSRIFVDDVLVLGYGNWVIPLLIGITLTAIIRFILSELQRSILTKARTKLAVDGTRELLVHIFKLPLSYFGTRFAGDIANRLHLTGNLASLLTGDVAQAVLNFITASFFLILMLAYSPSITLLILVLSVANIVITMSTTRIASEAHRKIAIESAKLNGIALSGLRDIETYKSSGSEDAFFSRWSGTRSNITSIQQTLAAKMIPIGALPRLLSSLTSAAILVFGGLEVMEGKMTVGTLVAFQSLGASFMAPVLGLTGMITQMQEIRSLTERIDDVLEHPVDVTFSAAQDKPGADDAEVQGRIEFRNLSFGYLPLEPPLIEGLDLNLDLGKRIALVGASGSGKSTVGRIAAGLLAPKSGELRIDGKPIHRISRRNRAQAIGYVDQDVVLFEGTVKDNLTLWDTSIASADMIQAAKDAEIHDVIVSRAGRYDSRVSEGGSNFSGGQRQRLEIARALALNPSVLIMDEATSALDTIAEARIMENIKVRGTSLLLIAHRLSTIRDCDEIIVLDRGTPIERGTHQELIGRDGTYASLIEA